MDDIISLFVNKTTIAFDIITAFIASLQGGLGWSMFMEKLIVSLYNMEHESRSFTEFIQYKYS